MMLRVLPVPVTFFLCECVRILAVGLESDGEERERERMGY